jgi:UDP-glucose 6-dehydrogenase
MTLVERYTLAMKKIGGAAGLLSLPKDVQEVLKKTNDLEVKVKMLEAIVKAKKQDSWLEG